MKKNNLALFTLFVIGLFSLFTQNTLAQKSVSTRKEQPKSNITKKDVLQNYVDVSSLPINKRTKFFSDLSIEEKANIFSLHLALQFIKRPKLTSDQKDLILESISPISADTYDRTKDRTTTELYSQSLQARVLSVFEKKEAFEIFASLGGEVEDVEMIRNYQGIMLIADITGRQKAFGKTTPSNKSNFWKIRFLHHLTTNPDLNPEQKSLLIEIVSRINKDLYINRNQSELAYKQKALMFLINKISRIFPDDKDRNVFSFGIDESPTSEEPGAARCHCLKDSRFSGCGINSTCGKGGSCNDSSDNGTHCGFLGLWPCDGRCG